MSKRKELLPIGSIVLLKNATHRLMIIGFSPMYYGENATKVYDYWGCFYPEGQIEPDQHLVFDHEDIDKIISQGFSDESEKDFRGKVQDVLPQVRDDKGVLTASPAELANIMSTMGKEE